MTGQQRLAQWRKKQGLTLKDAGTMLGVTASALCRIEGGGEPSIKLANTIDAVTRGPWRVRTEHWGRLEVGT